MIISVGGKPGSGKSVLAKALAKKLRFKHYYIGGLRRMAAKKRGLTLEEYNKLGAKDPKTDFEVDKYQKKLGKTEDNFIIEGRISWYFIPKSLKIFLDTDYKIAAKRIYGDLKKKNNRNEGKNLDSIEKVLKSLKKRDRGDAQRYKKYYNIDVYGKKHYDFYLDASYLAPKETLKKVYEFIKKNIDK